MKVVKLILILLLLSEMTYSQNADDVVIAKRISINSTVLGEERTISVSTPSGYTESKDSYPVMYVLDGSTGVIGVVNYLSAYSVCPEMIIVVIEEVNPSRDMFPSKPKYRRGLSPAESWYNKKEDDEIKVYRPDEKVGESDKFLSFIETELFPFVEKTYRTLPYRICSGHSKGGLSVTHAFLSRTNMFNAYIALCPSLYWDDGLLMKMAEEKLAGINLKYKQFYFSVGGNEVPSTVGDAHTFAATLKLKSSAELRWKFDYLENEDHGSGATIGIINGLKFIFDGWKYDSDKMMAGGIRAIDDFYNDQSERYGYRISPDVSTFNTIGWGLLRTGKQEEAMNIFRENTRRFPDSPDAYNYLAEGYLRAGNIDLAIKSYEKAVELATNFKTGNLEFLKRRLESIKAERK
ncbi:MAG: alpha/beta hydrolase-fold protein [Lentimicrobiaceae bacterium]